MRRVEAPARRTDIVATDIVRAERTARQRVRHLRPRALIDGRRPSKTAAKAGIDAASHARRAGLPAGARERDDRREPIPAARRIDVPPPGAGGGRLAQARRRRRSNNASVRFHASFAAASS